MVHNGGNQVSEHTFFSELLRSLRLQKTAVAALPHSLGWVLSPTCIRQRCEQEANPQKLASRRPSHDSGHPAEPFHVTGPPHVIGPGHAVNRSVSSSFDANESQHWLRSRATCDSLTVNHFELAASTGNGRAGVSAGFTTKTVLKALVICAALHGDLNTCVFLLMVLGEVRLSALCLDPKPTDLPHLVQDLFRYCTSVTKETDALGRVEVGEERNRAANTQNNSLSVDEGKIQSILDGKRGGNAIDLVALVIALLNSDAKRKGLET